MNIYEEIAEWVDRRAREIISERMEAQLSTPVDSSEDRKCYDEDNAQI